MFSHRAGRGKGALFGCLDGALIRFLVPRVSALVIWERPLKITFVFRGSVRQEARNSNCFLPWYHLGHMNDGRSPSSGINSVTCDQWTPFWCRLGVLFQSRQDWVRFFPHQRGNLLHSGKKTKLNQNGKRDMTHMNHSEGEQEKDCPHSDKKSPDLKGFPHLLRTIPTNRYSVWMCCDISSAFFSFLIFPLQWYQHCKPASSTTCHTSSFHSLPDYNKPSLSSLSVLFSDPFM